MSIFVVVYTYKPEYAKLAELRPARYQFFQELESRGLLLASGQLLDDDLGQGMLVLTASSIKEAAKILDGDPLATAGLIDQRIISAWNPTTGSWVSR